MDGLCWAARKPRPASPGPDDLPRDLRATDKPVTCEDKLKRFRVRGFLATCRMEAEVSVPSRGFAVIGEAVNGRHCDELAAK
jgi:hypothetical protein